VRSKNSVKGVIVSDVAVLYVSDCPNVSIALEHLRGAGVDLKVVRMVEVHADGPIPNGFAGSPTVLIDGVNPLWMSSDGVDVSCSLRMATVEQLRAALVG
jgi:hypothetical protein